MDYIAADSKQAVAKVSQAIRKATRDLARYPGHWPPDKYRLVNDGSFRALLIYRYRISYHVGEDEIRIIRFRHISQQSEFY